MLFYVFLCARRRSPTFADSGNCGWCDSSYLQGNTVAPHPTCSLLHACLLLCAPDGVNGGSHEGYVKWACTTAQQRGWRAVVLNLRGCNGLDVSSPRG